MMLPMKHLSWKPKKMGKDQTFISGGDQIKDPGSTSDDPDLARRG